MDSPNCANRQSITAGQIHLTLLPARKDARIDAETGWQQMGLVFTKWAGRPLGKAEGVRHLLRVLRRNHRGEEKRHSVIEIPMKEELRYNWA